MNPPGDALSQLQAKDKEIDALKAELDFHGFNPNEHCAGKGYHPLTDELEARAEKAEAELAEAHIVQKATESNLGVQYDRLEDENRALKAELAESPTFDSVKVVDTTGCGDSFMAAAITGLLNGDDLASLSTPELTDIVTFANAAATIVGTRYGASDAMPHLPEVEKFLAVHPGAMSADSTSG